jgi:hypothetical protein
VGADSYRCDRPSFRFVGICLRSAGAQDHSPVSGCRRMVVCSVRAQFRQHGDVGRDASRFLAGEPVHHYPPTGFVVEIRVCDRLSVGVAGCRRSGGLVDPPRWEGDAADRSCSYALRPELRISECVGTLPKLRGYILDPSNGKPCFGLICFYFGHNLKRGRDFGRVLLALGRAPKAAIKSRQIC